MRLSAFCRLLFVLAVMALGACSRLPHIVGVDNPEMPVAQTVEATKQKVFIVTTREASEVTQVFFSEARAPELGFASVTVSIPPNHQPGELEHPKRLPPDPMTEMAIVDPALIDSGSSFVNQINRELAKRAPEDRKVLFFIHGYNNSTSESILRLAQFVEDTEFNGVPVLFAWASGAKASLYVYDLNSALAARPRLMEAAGLLRQTNASGFDIFAHSMGSMLTVEAIVQASVSGRYTSSRLENVMLASPDIDIDLFRSQLNQLRREDRNFFIFVSQDDRALGFSRMISGGIERVGSAQISEFDGLGVTVIDITQIDDSSSGSHSKFAGSPEVVQLIGRGLKNDHYRPSSNQRTLGEYLAGVPVLGAFVP